MSFNYLRDAQLHFSAVRPLLHQLRQADEARHHEQEIFDGVFQNKSGKSPLFPGEGGKE